MATEVPNETDPNADGARAAGGFRRARKLAISLNTVVVLLLAAVIAVMVNYLSIRHYKRMDWTSTQYYSLSDKSVELLKSIKEPITCIVFFQPGQEVYDDIRSLLKEYQDKSSQLKVEYVDPDRNPVRTEQLAEEYKVASPNVVIFARGSGDKRKSKYVNASEIVEVDYGGGMFGRAPQKKAFKGEQAFTSAIQNILESEQPTIYFLTGHGERDPDSFDERGGYSTLNTYLKRENLKVAKLNLAITNQVPADCSVLVVAGPGQPVPEPERQVLEQYLQNKGRLLVLLDAQKESGLESVLQNWGVTVHNDIIVGLVSILGLKTELSASAICNQYGPSPIVQKMEGINTTFPRACSLDVDSQPPSPTPDRPRTTWLVKTMDAFWGETDLANLGTSVKYDASADRKGPLTVAVAVESGNLPGTPVEIASTRLVVVGSSSFVANGVIDGANLDFFLNSVNWLINKPERVLGISPKTPLEFRLSLNEVQVQTLKLTLIFGIPGGVAVIGAVVWWRRRK